MKLKYWAVAAAKRDYYTLVAGIESEVPEALADPIIATAVAQMKTAELALRARLDEITEEYPE